MTEYRAALIDVGRVCRTVVILDDAIPYEIPVEWLESVPLADDSPVGPGWTYTIRNEWKPPPEPDPPA